MLKPCCSIRYVTPSQRLSSVAKDFRSLYHDPGFQVFLYGLCVTRDTVLEECLPVASKYTL